MKKKKFVSESQVIDLRPHMAGKRVELEVHKELQQRGFKLLNTTAGSTNERDLIMIHEDESIGIEVKAQNAKEGGQGIFKLYDGQLVNIHPLFSMFLNGYVPFQGHVPSFLTGDKSFETWLKEKSLFKGEYVSVPDDSVAKYYANKGSSYIYIYKKGIFHTGVDPCGWGVPMFIAPTRIRIRCKQHGSSSMPSSVMASLVYKM